ncbi:MAG: single-stranded DNA-binding protein [Micromonosporaceae bacterium]
MHDTHVTVTGNLVTKPERRRVESNGSTVVNFRIGSTSRRFDKASGAWMDGNSFFVKVSCWRGLADNAFQSLFKGDPVVVTGRLFTREYIGDDGQKRTSYEMEATGIGHNLARGTSTFVRTRAVPTTEVVTESADEAPLPEEATEDQGADQVEEHEAESFPYQRLDEPVAVAG